MLTLLCLLPQINGMLLVHLPDGPTARFRLSSLVLGKDIKVRGAVVLQCANACRARFCSCT